MSPLTVPVRIPSSEVQVGFDLVVHPPDEVQLMPAALSFAPAEDCVICVPDRGTDTAKAEAAREEMKRTAEANYRETEQ